MAPSATTDMPADVPEGKGSGFIHGSVMYRALGQKPPSIVDSKGHFLYASDGREIMDATGGVAVASIGHNHPKVKADMIKQLDTVSYCYVEFFTTPPAEKLSRMLTESTGGQMNMVFLVSSGKGGGYRELRNTVFHC